MPSAWRLTQTPLQSHEPQSKTRVEFTAVMRSAASQARHRTAYAADTRKFLPAIWAPVNETRHVSPCRKRQIVAALFIRDSQIVASVPPLGAMGQDVAPTGTKLSEKMGQFMAQRAIDFGRMLRQPRV